MHSLFIFKVLSLIIGLFVARLQIEDTEEDSFFPIA